MARLIAFVLFLACLSSISAVTQVANNEFSVSVSGPQPSYTFQALSDNTSTYTLSYNKLYECIYNDTAANNTPPVACTGTADCHTDLSELNFNIGQAQLRSFDNLTFYEFNVSNDGSSDAPWSELVLRNRLVVSNPDFNFTSDNPSNLEIDLILTGYTWSTIILDQLCLDVSFRLEGSTEKLTPRTTVMGEPSATVDDGYFSMSPTADVQDADVNLNEDDFVQIGADLYLSGNGMTVVYDRYGDDAMLLHSQTLGVVTGSSSNDPFMSSSSDSSDDDDLSTGAIVGIAIGSAAGAALIVGAIGYAVHSSSKRSQYQDV